MTHVAPTGADASLLPLHLSGELQADACIRQGSVSQHVALPRAGSLETSPRTLGHLFGFFWQRFSSFACLAVYSVTVSSHCMAPLASSQSPRYLLKCQCPLNSLLAQPFSLDILNALRKSSLLSCFSPLPIFFHFSQICVGKGGRGRSEEVPSVLIAEDPAAVEVLHFFRCSLAQSSSAVLLLGGRDPGRSCSALLLCCSHPPGLQSLWLPDPALEF